MRRVPVSGCRVFYDDFSATYSICEAHNRHPVECLQQAQRENEALKAQLTKAKADTHKTLPCGHCEGALSDDHCGLPEHRFCAICNVGECYGGWEKTASDLHSKLDRATKVVEAAKAVEARYAHQSDGDIHALTLAIKEFDGDAP